MAIEGINNGVQYNDRMTYNSTKADKVVAATTVNTVDNDKSTPQIKDEKEETVTTPEQEKRIKSAVDQMNTQIRNKRTRCEFQYHEETSRVSIKVIDRDTDKVIREIPPEKTLEMVEKMWEIAGLLVDEKR